MKIFRLFFLIVIVFLFFYLFVLDFVPGEKLEIKYDFCKKVPMVTELSPGDRLWPIEKSNGECWQKIAASPIYFDTRAPQYFDRSRVEVKYKNQAEEKFQLGPQTKKNEWLWLLQDVVEYKKEGGWQLGRADFDLRGVYQESPVMRWLISAPNLEENKNVIWVNEIKINFYKDKLSLDNFWQQVKGWGRKIYDSRFTI